MKSLTEKIALKVLVHLQSFGNYTSDVNC